MGQQYQCQSQAASSAESLLFAKKTARIGIGRRTHRMCYLIEITGHQYLHLFFENRASRLSILRRSESRRHASRISYRRIPRYTPGKRVWQQSLNLVLLDGYAPTRLPGAVSADKTHRFLKQRTGRLAARIGRSGGELRCGVNDFNQLVIAMCVISAHVDGIDESF